MSTAASDRELHETEVVGTPSLSVRVREGEGTPIVLLHGLGRTLEDWEPFTRSLRRNHPLYAVDMRGHGHSADGVWSLDSFVDDLIRVVGHFGLHRPVVVGHDLGAVAAASFGTRRGDLTGVVGINGYGWPRVATVAHRLGMPCQEAQSHIRAIRRYVMADMSEMLAPMPHTAFERLLDGLRSGPLGLPGEVLTASARRAATVDGDVVSPRPGPRAIRALCGALDEFDADRIRRELRVPALSLVSTGPVHACPGAPQRFSDVLAAQAANELAARAELVTARGVDAPHTMHMTHPETVARLIEDFLAAI
ncbi:pimeloyl-ACP methyl ester carboxylesterase [Lipingzhangella halophila]|uniref:Pimeloyl-ACP methyl ester carboxylesterase n=1 Tax=Lipingzhangella halophila TaxID=1783352 RepID=A0A7W7RL36_9ACTN|nr:alpha/beta hydrolase [Lipingzhangella halophila]MBB4933921.1 pimeloyl-ACP methyl ester carboxylesterase [Lipingzhangella halophila]